MHKTNPHAPLTTADCKVILDSQYTYLQSLQISDGAIRKSLELGQYGYEIDPYFSNLGALALLEDIQYVPLVKKWIEWYLKKVGANGIIHKLWATNITGRIKYQDRGEFDSIDSYAATFISVCRKFYDKSPGDRPWLATKKNEILNIAGALSSMIDPADGLTWNLSPNDSRRRVKYTMDNAEANKGMQDMIYLYQKAFNMPKPIQWQNYLTNNTNAFNQFWDNTNGCYLVALAIPADWQKLNPDAACQFYALINKVTKPTDPTIPLVTALFEKNFKTWPTATLKDDDCFPCSVLAHAMALAGQKADLTTYLTNIKSQIESGHLPDTWYNMEAAEIILATNLYLKMK